MKRGVRLGRNQNALKHNGVDQEDKQLAGCCLAVIIETAVDGVKNAFHSLSYILLKAKLGHSPSCTAPLCVCVAKIHVGLIRCQFHKPNHLIHISFSDAKIQEPYYTMM